MPWFLVILPQKFQYFGITAMRKPSLRCLSRRDTSYVRTTTWRCGYSYAIGWRIVNPRALRAKLGEKNETPLLQFSKINTTDAPTMVISVISGQVSPVRGTFARITRCFRSHGRRGGCWGAGTWKLWDTADTAPGIHPFHHPKLGLPTSHRNDHWKGWTHITSETRRFSHSYSMGSSE